MKKIVIGRYGFKCSEETENEYMISTWGIGGDGKFHMGEVEETLNVKENHFYKVYHTECNRDGEVETIIVFIHNNKIVVGEYFETNTIDFYDMEEEEIYDIPKDIENKAIKFCYYGCKEKYAEF